MTELAQFVCLVGAFLFFNGVYDFLRFCEIMDMLEDWENNRGVSVA